MPILESLTKNPETSQASILDGRFFNVSPTEIDTDSPELRNKADEAFVFSQDFWKRHSDLLADDNGMVFHRGIDEQGKLTSIDRQWNKSVSLIFDAGERTKGIYDWQLTIAEKYGSREVHRLNISQTELAAKVKRYDRQGRGREVYAEKPEPIADLINELANSAFITKEIEKRRSKKETSKQMLAEFMTVKINNYDHDKYIKGKKTYNTALINLTFRQYVWIHSSH